MSTPTTIRIDDIEYIRADSLTPPPSGKRVVLVIDRGWIYAGDLSHLDDDYWRLDRALHIRSWSGVGFDGMLADPTSANVTIKPLCVPVEVPPNSVISRHPVTDDWGL